MLNSKALAASASAAKVYVEDVFSTWLYTGNSSTQTITNGIDLSGKGGLVWFKQRNSGSSHELVDTVRGAGKGLDTRLTNAQSSSTDLTTFNADGFSLGYNTGNANFNTGTFASWTFRKAAKFFDVITYVGDGNAGRTVSHSLGSTPGCIILKEYSAGTGDAWYVWHRGYNSGDGHGFLNTTAAFSNATTPNIFGNGSSYVAPTSTNFTVGGSAGVNESGATYVAYLFAHDAGGFGDSGNDSVVSCGSFTQVSGGTTVNLGWEPQWVLVRASSTASNWFVFDNMRGNTVSLFPNLTNAETDQGSGSFQYNATGFTMADYITGSVGSTIIYIAIRRGPMKTPTDATKVFSAITATGGSGTVRTVGFPADLSIATRRNGEDRAFVDKLRGAYSASATSTGQPRLAANTTAAEDTGFYPYSYDWTNTSATDGGFANSQSTAWYYFRRAPGFFDVVAYTGTGSTQALNHNLAVVPELLIVKDRSFDAGWHVYSADLGSGFTTPLTTSASYATTIWGTPTSTTFTVAGASSVNNQSGDTYIAYLFATCPGVSKCFSFTGNGTSQTIDCGFTAGAKFVLIKRTDSTGNWLVADTARGIVSGNDPLLYLNSTAAEITTLDWIDPDNSGFIVNQESTANANVNGATYIGLAIA